VRIVASSSSVREAVHGVVVNALVWFIVINDKSVTS